MPSDGLALPCVKLSQAQHWSQVLFPYQSSGCSSIDSFKLVLRRWVIHTLRWRHNGCNGVSNHQPHHYLLNRLFRRRSKKASKLRVTGLCVGNSPVTGEFPTQMASNTENVSIWWRHHEEQTRTTILYQPYSQWGTSHIKSNYTRLFQSPPSRLHLDHNRFFSALH